MVGGVELADLPDPARAREALDAVGFLVSLEQRPSEVTDRADVVLPVAAVAEKAGTFLNWEGRARLFEAAIKPDQVTTRHQLPDARVLTCSPTRWTCTLGLPDVRGARAELRPARRLVGPRYGTEPQEAAVPLPRPEPGQAVLAGHRLLLDQGRLQDGDDALAATRHPAVARLSAATAARGRRRGRRPARGHRPGRHRHAAAGRSPPMPDRVVWLPLNSVGRRSLPGHSAPVPGQVVTIGAAPRR